MDYSSVAPLPENFKVTTWHYVVKLNEIAPDRTRSIELSDLNPSREGFDSTLKDGQLLVERIPGQKESGVTPQIAPTDVKSMILQRQRKFTDTTPDNLRLQRSRAVNQQLRSSGSNLMEQSLGQSAGSSGH
jgi:hypothetical protein